MMSFMYDYYKRKSAKILYGIESPSVWRALEGPVCLFLNAVIVLTITYVASSFSGLKKDREYRVADKVAPTSSTNIKMEDNENVSTEGSSEGAQPVEEEKSQLLVK